MALGVKDRTVANSVWQKEESRAHPKADGLASAHGLPSGNFWADIYNMK
jgi:hypothetical protein